MDNAKRRLRSEVDHLPMGVSEDAREPRGLRLRHRTSGAEAEAETSC